MCIVWVVFKHVYARVCGSSSISPAVEMHKGRLATMTEPLHSTQPAAAALMLLSMWFWKVAKRRRDMGRSTCWKLVFCVGHCDILCSLRPPSTTPTYPPPFAPAELRCSISFCRFTQYDSSVSLPLCVCLRARLRASVCWLYMMGEWRTRRQSTIYAKDGCELCSFSWQIYLIKDYNN